MYLFYANLYKNCSIYLIIDSIIINHFGYRRSGTLAIEGGHDIDEGIIRFHSLLIL